MRIFVYLIGCVCLAGCNPPLESARSSNVPPDQSIRVRPISDGLLKGQPIAQQLVTTYHSLRAMTEKPVYVNAGLAMLCRGASQAEVEKAREQSGPHAHTAVSIYMNDLAADTFGKPGRMFPVGAVIVKEKKALSYWSATPPHDMTAARDGVGGMIKRPPGYDPEHGDWEYFYLETPTTEEARPIESGKIQSCVQCHSSAAKQDYVFGDWARNRKPGP